MSATLNLSLPDSGQPRLSPWGRDLPDADGSWYLERERALSANCSLQSVNAPNCQPKSGLSGMAIAEYIRVLICQRMSNKEN